MTGQTIWRVRLKWCNVSVFPEFMARSPNHHSGNACASLGAPGGDPIKKINGVCHSLFHHSSYHRITSSHHHRAIEVTLSPHISRAPTSGRAINNRQSASPLFTPYLLPDSRAGHRSAIHIHLISPCPSFARQRIFFSLPFKSPPPTLLSDTHSLKQGPFAYILVHHRWSS